MVSIKLTFLCAAFCICMASLPLKAIIEEQAALKELDLDTAVYRVLTQSVNLNIAGDDAQAKRALVLQASLYPNPDLIYEAEKFAGTNEWKSWKNREEFLIWSQLIETAGKRRLRTQAASYQYYAALVGYDVSKLILLNRLNRAYINVVALQEKLKITLDQAEIAKEVLRIATVKVEAGKVSLIQQNKAEVAYSSTLIEVEKARIELKNAKKRLSLLWSISQPDFDNAIFPFYETPAPVALELCLAELCNQAEVVQSFYQYQNAEKIWRLEKANRIPNVTLQVGYKAHYAEKSQGMVAGFIVPIPIFNQNQGNVGRAYFDMLKTGDQGRQLWLILESRLAISHEELMRAYEEAERIKNYSLPSANQAFDLAQKGYKEGKFEYLDVLDAQRTLFEVREKYIQALVNYHTRRADIEYLNSQMD